MYKVQKLEKLSLKWTPGTHYSSSTGDSCEILDFPLHSSVPVTIVARTIKSVNPASRDLDGLKTFINDIR